MTLKFLDSGYTPLKIPDVPLVVGAPVPSPPPIVRDLYEFAPPEFIDPLDRLRSAFHGLTEENWCELGRQLQCRAAPVRLTNRASIIAWLKTWTYR